MTAFFLGAGCSRGTLKESNSCPVSKDFREYLAKCSTIGGQFKNLEIVFRYLDETFPKVGLEELWSCIDHYAKFWVQRCGFLREPKWNQAEAVCELKRAVLRLCGSACEDAARAIRRTSKCTLVSILRNQVKSGDVVVSFNWDMLVERLAKKCELNFVHCSGRPRKNKKEIKFVKPHGSVSWQVGRPPAILPFAPMLRVIREGDVKPGESPTEPLLLGAVPMKSELIFEVAAHYCACAVFKVIMDQWQAVVEAVRDADSFVVLGYSFPKEDQYGRFFFQEGMRKRLLVCRVRSLVTASDRLWGRMDSCAPVANRRWTVPFTRDQAGYQPPCR